MAHKKYNFLLALFILSFIISIILSIIPTSDICSVELGCNIVQKSVYNSFLGIKNSFFGIFIFGILSILTYLQIKYHLGYRRKLINYAVSLGFFISLYFLYIQFFVLHAFCKYCVVVDISTVIAFILTVLWWKE